MREVETKNNNSNKVVRDRAANKEVLGAFSTAGRAVGVHTLPLLASVPAMWCPEQLGTDLSQRTGKTKIQQRSWKGCSLKADGSHLSLQVEEE